MFPFCVASPTLILLAFRLLPPFRDFWCVPIHSRGLIHPLDASAIFFALSILVLRSIPLRVRITCVILLSRPKQAMESSEWVRLDSEICSDYRPVTVLSLASVARLHDPFLLYNSWRNVMYLSCTSSLSLLLLSVAGWGLPPSAKVRSIWQVH